MFKRISQPAFDMIKELFLLAEEGDESRFAWSLRLGTMDGDPTWNLNLCQDELKDVETAPFTIIDGKKVSYLIPDEHLAFFADHIIHFDQERRRFIPLKTLDIELHRGD